MVSVLASSAIYFDNDLRSISMVICDTDIL